MTKNEATKRALAYGWCRAIGHSWGPNGPIRITKRGYELSVQCAHCDTVRTTIVDRTGRTKASLYSWPDDYLLEKEVRITKAGVRRMVFVEGRAFQIDRSGVAQLGATQTEENNEQRKE